MYDELVKSLRQCAEASCAGCKNDLVQIGCRGLLQQEAADAIETLYAAYTESFSVIAKAFRNNPKDLVLREYMMKNACCCEAEEVE